MILTTLMDVANKANVSKMTVSRVINHPEKVTDELKELVYKAMEELDYKPNRLAKALANQKTQMVKLYILEEMDSVEPYYMNLLTGIAGELDRHAYGLQLITRDSHNLGDSDGYIICGMRESDFDSIDQLTDPVVLFGENSHGYDFVDSNNLQNIEQACDHCVDCGYDRLIYIEMKVDEPFAKKRKQGYLESMARHNLEPTILSFDNNSDQVHDYLMNHMDDFAPNTAFVCATDRLAIGAVRALTLSNKAVPKDYGVIGHDGVFLDQIAYPKLTTIRQDVKGMGEACAQMILKRINNQDLPQHKLYCKSQLIEGGTTRTRQY